jgi:hypothetical protein
VSGGAIRAKATTADPVVVSAMPEDAAPTMAGGPLAAKIGARPRTSPVLRADEAAAAAGSAVAGAAEGRVASAGIGVTSTEAARASPYAPTAGRWTIKQKPSPKNTPTVAAATSAIEIG